MKIRIEGVRDGLSNLNLSKELVDVEIRDHLLMDMTLAVVSMERSELSLGREEQFLDSVMEQAEIMDTSNHTQEVMENEQEDSIFEDRNRNEQWGPALTNHGRIEK